MFQQLARVARVLGHHRVARRQHLAGALSQVAQVPDRRRNEVQRHLRPGVEGVFEVQQGRTPGAVRHGNHVEADAALRAAPAGEVVARRGHDSPLLGGGHRLLRPAERRRRPRADFDKDQ